MTEGTDMNQIEKVARAAAWLRECHNWLLANDYDMECPMETDPLDLAEELEAIAAMPVQAEPQWQGIESAPDMDRVIVAGWEPRSGNVRGYWWYGEDVVINGRATMHPRATLWRPFNNPAFPTPPAGGSDAE